MFLAIVTPFMVGGAASFVRVGCCPYANGQRFISLSPCCPSRTICISSMPQSAVAHDCYTVSHSVHVTRSLAGIASTKIALADCLSTSNSFLEDKLHAFFRDGYKYHIPFRFVPG